MANKSKIEPIKKDMKPIYETIMRMDDKDSDEFF